MKTARFRGCLIVFFSFFALPATLPAGTLDDYYLTRFGENSARSSMDTLPQVTAATERCGTSLRRGLRRDWKLLTTSAQSSLAKYLARPLLSGTELTVDSPSGRFRVHYTTAGADAATVDWAQTTARIFDDVYAVEVQKMGYLPPPPPSAGAPYDIYLQDQASSREYGYTQELSPTQPGGISYSAYTVLDRSFTSSIYAPYTPLESLQVTAAHEFYHSIQFGYNFYLDIWYAEATATWMEDELYDGVNELYDYLPAAIANSSLSLDSPASTATGGGYGRWLITRYLAEQHGIPVMRKMMENLALIPPPAGGGDIPMIPLLDTVLSREYSSSLASDYFGFSERIYSRDWMTHTNEIDPPATFIPGYRPLATYYSYPVTSSSFPTPSITLPHYSYAYFRLPVTSSGVRITSILASGMKATVFRSHTGSSLPPDSYQPLLNSSGQDTIYIPADATTGEIVLLICNPTAIDNLSASFTSVALPLTATMIVTLSGNGSGTVTSNPPGIFCNNTTCSYPFPGGVIVNLVATPGIGSLFSSWGGDCSGSEGCSLTLDGGKSATATFTSPLPARIGLTPYPDLQSAYDNAVSGDLIMLKEGVLPGSLHATTEKIVSIRGGYSPSYTAPGAPSIIQGSLTLGLGSIILQDLVVR